MSFTAPSLTFGTRGFDGGFLDTPESDTLPPNASPDARNMLLTSVELASGAGKIRGVLRKRFGSALLNPVVISSGKAIDGLFEFLRDTGATGELLAICNGTLYKFDGVDTFNAISGGTGFTAGNAVRMLLFRNNAFLSDGLQNLRYNGTAGLPVGFIAPTAAPALAVVAGPGVTGTYEGFAVWYDSTMDHESSPSAIAAATAFANQQRQWTKPAGAPPANVDKWRIYCRRTDTNERNFYRCAEVVVGTATFTEAVIDAARVEIGPNPNDNDVPPVFALQEEFKGFRFGVRLNSSDLYVSKQYDPESQHPKNLFPIGGKGDQKPIRCVRKYGEECLVQKPRRSYRVVGDQLPFQFVPIQSSLGNVSQDAGLEVRDYFYAWDEGVGPYRTNLETWEPLADNRIANFVSTVARQSLDSIRAAHSVKYNLILWSVPTGSSARRRTLLAYNYVLDKWLPPITGFEYASLSEFTTSAGDLGVYFGDYLGRVYHLFTGEVDGPPSGDTSAVITACTSGLITAAGASFYTTGAGLAGMPVAVKSPSGTWQWVRCQSNTGTQITLDTTNGTPLAPVPDPATGTWTVYLGAIQAYWLTPATDHGDPQKYKYGRWLFVQGRTTASATIIRVDCLLDQASAYDQSFDIAFPTGGGVWGQNQWGQFQWGDTSGRAGKKRRINRKYLNVQLRFSNFYPSQPFLVTAFSIGADPVRKSAVSSG
jgi:hypothetical protein